jgi:protein SCO1/2
VGATPEKDKTITHSLTTVMIGQDGKVSHVYWGNEWTPEQVLDDVRKLAG